MPGQIRRLVHYFPINQRQLDFRIVYLCNWYLKWIAIQDQYIGEHSPFDAAGFASITHMAG